MKTKTLLQGHRVVCANGVHTIIRTDGKIIEAICWCKWADKKQLKRWGK